MENNLILIGLAGVLVSAAPILFASIGETFSERAGVINLSVNGTILLSAMGSFVVAIQVTRFLNKMVEQGTFLSGMANPEGVIQGVSLLTGFIVGSVIGGLVALVVAFSSITLKQSQVAVGFVLALMTRDLSYFLGNDFMGEVGPRLGSAPLPLLKDIPVLGILLFRADVMTYLSYLLIIIAWVWIFKTRPGLILQGVGEKPAAAYVRGANVNRQRYIYTVLGGLLVGVAGPIYSLSVKAGWKGTISGLDGIGWIALAITIFGAWNPLRVAFGAYLFSLLQWLGLVLQSSMPDVPSQVLQVAPFPLMILTLLLVNIGNAEWVERALASLPEGPRHFLNRLIRSLRSSPPSALGTPFEKQ